MGWPNFVVRMPEELHWTVFRAHIGEGEPNIDGEPGDLLLHINMSPHKRFWRVGNDLYTNITISLEDALLGFETEIPHLDKHKTKVSRKEVTKPGTMIKIPKEGMMSYENNHVFGNMYVTFNVAFPDGTMPDTARDPIKSLLHEYHDAPKSYRGM